MKKQMVLLGMLMLVLALAIPLASTGAAPQADCEAFGTGAITSLSSLTINFNCASDATVYFGVCDSGPIADDLFTVVFNGNTVAFNSFSGGVETITVGSASASAGAQMATMNNLQDLAPSATYSYAVSSAQVDVENYVQANCGADFGGLGTPTACSYGPRNVPVFTMDAAPSDGTLEFRLMIGNEDSREVSGLMQSWDVKAGQQINNAMVTNLPFPRYARLYWQPAGESTWYMLTSQYWHGPGSKASEYGISCIPGDMPSYHTSFSSAIPEDESW